MSRSYGFTFLARVASVASVASVTSVTWVALIAIVASGCSVPLDAGREPVPEASLATSPGCRLFAGNLAPSGAARSTVAEGGSTLWVLDGESGSTATSFFLPAGARTDDCLAAAKGPVTPALEGGNPDMSRAVMSLVSSPAGARLYFEELEPAPGEPFGVRTRGFGVAEQIPGTGRFHVAPTLVWAGDRPRYGTAAVVKGDDVYAFGCVNVGFLTADCYVARAPVASMADEAAYSYYEGAGRFTSDPGRAWPVVRGAGTSIAVTWSPARNRYLMVYATPLGKTWHARTGLSPEGPWSDDHELAAADVGGDGDAFVVGVALHPELLEGDRARIPVTYALAAFSGDFGARQAASPERLGPRLTVLALPDDLPLADVPTASSQTANVVGVTASSLAPHSAQLHSAQCPALVDHRRGSCAGRASDCVRRTPGRATEAGRASARRAGPAGRGASTALPSTGPTVSPRPASADASPGNGAACRPRTSPASATRRGRAGWTGSTVACRAARALPARAGETRTLWGYRTSGRATSAAPRSGRAGKLPLPAKQQWTAARRRLSCS